MRIVVTRPRVDGERTATALRARGHEVLVTPLMRIEPIAANFEGEWSGTIVTSANAANAIRENSSGNALMKLPFKGVYNFRPGLMTPKPGQKHLKTSYRIALVFAPLLKLFFRTLTLSQVGRAMIRCAQSGAPKHVLEIADIAALSES